MERVNYREVLSRVGTIIFGPETTQETRTEENDPFAYLLVSAATEEIVHGNHYLSRLYTEAYFRSTKEYKKHTNPTIT